MIATTATERRKLIVELIQELGFMRNSDLAEKLDVSIVTVRQDLETLAEQGLIQKVYGGGIAANGGNGHGGDTAYESRAQLYTVEKRRIGAAAAKLIQPGETILLDAGSTTLEVARRLPEQSDLTVVTSALNIAMEAGNREGVSVVVCGGEYNPQTLSVFGHNAEQLLQQLHADRLFLGTYGVGLEKGLADRTFANAQFKRAMIHAAREVVLVCDSSKFGENGTVLVASLDDIDRVITDTGIPPEYRDYFEARGVPVDTL